MQHCSRVVHVMPRCARAGLGMVWALSCIVCMCVQWPWLSYTRQPEAYVHGYPWSMIGAQTSILLLLWLAHLIFLGKQKYKRICFPRYTSTTTTDWQTSLILIVVFASVTQSWE